jgi:NitT/TauT family transport system ATP-binding protein
VTPQAAPPIGLRLENIDKRYGGLYALRRVSLEIAAGECVALAGRNGSGKTTLLRVVAQLVKPSAGKLMFPVPQHGAASTQRNTGFVAHATMVYDELTAEENLFLFARLLGIADATKRVGLLLNEVGLGERRDSLVRTFSRGMRQRVAIARALALDPQVLLMDEPFGALDAITREEMSRCLLDIWQRTGKTIVLVTHSIDEAIFLSREVHVMGTNPARIIETLPIALPTPRNDDTFAEPAFKAAEKRLRGLLFEGKRRPA